MFFSNFKKYLFLGIAFSCVALIVIYVGNVINIVNFCNSLTGGRWLGLFVVAVLLLLPIVFVTVNFIKILTTYTPLQLANILDSDTDNMDKERIKLLQILSENSNDENEIAEIQMTLNDTDLSRKIFLQNFYAKQKEKCNSQAHKYSLIAAASVVISPQSAGDMLAMLVWNFRTITNCIQIYGIRPKLVNLIQLYFFTVFGSLLAGSIQDVIAGASGTIPGADKIPFLSPIGQASGAVFSILKTSALTQYYIMHGLSRETRKEAGNNANKEALKELPKLMQNEELRKCVLGTLSNTFTKFGDFFSSKEAEPTENPEEV